MRTSHQRPENTQKNGMSPALDIVQDSGVTYDAIAYALGLPAIVEMRQQQIQNDANGIERLTLMTRFECDEDLNYAAMIMAAWLVSQPRAHCKIGLPTLAQSRAFMAAVRLHLDVFKHNDQYGWELAKHDVRKLIEIRVRFSGAYSKLRVEVMKGG